MTTLSDEHGAGIVASLARQSEFYAANDRTIPAGPDDDALRDDDGDEVERRTWHNGDVVQTVVPYDDWPITVARVDGEWQSLGLPDKGNGWSHTDDEVTLWVHDGTALVKVYQDHQWEYGSAGALGPAPRTLGDLARCFLCGTLYADLTDDQKAGV